jgi:NAD(P)H-dependent FMN reductase
MTAPRRPREPFRLLVFSASLRSGSLNTRLAELAIEIVEAGGGEVGRGSMREFDCPSYDDDVQEAEGFPPRAEALRGRLNASDGFIAAVPEYNGRCRAC